MRSTTASGYGLGHGFGPGVITDVLAAVDVSGATLLLQAGNRHLAEYFYAPLGFDVQWGEETAKRPWIERAPALAVVLTECASSPITSRRASALADRFGV